MERADFLALRQMGQKEIAQLRSALHLFFFLPFKETHLFARMKSGVFIPR